MQKILIVEDDDNLSSGLRALFESEGFSCVTCGDGASGFGAFQQHEFDICIIDLMLPVMDGSELCREIRRVNDNLPIVILSARSNEEERIMGFNIGADDYVTKPFSAAELVARVKAILKRTQLTSPTKEFTFGDLIVNVDRQRAVRDGHVIELSAREIKILKFLSDQPGVVITRDQLMDYAWGRAYIPSSRALDQYVSELRKKVEPNPSKPRLIVTVWGRGYRYEPI